MHNGLITLYYSTQVIYLLRLVNKILLLNLNFKSDIQINTTTLVTIPRLHFKIYINIIQTYSMVYKCIYK